MTKVFISYGREDLEAARKLYEELKSVPGVDPWFDKECLLPGMRWRPAIRKAIRESQFFIALLSKSSTTKKGFVQKEMNDALAILEEFPEDKIFLIPIRLEECNVSFESLREIQYVDFFPNRGEGLKKVLKVISPDLKINAKGKGVISTGYEYRCGIVDLDMGLTNLLQIGQRLNSIQKFFHFTCPSISLTHHAVRSIEGFPNLAVYLLPQSLYEQRQYLNVDLVACLTKYPLAFKSGSYIQFNYFSGPSDVDDRFMFISTHSLYDFTKQANCTFEKGIAYIIVSQLLVYFTDLGYHDETKGCVMDFCEIRSDMVKGLKEMKLCPECLARIEDANLKEAVQAILADEMKV